jgi:hypothetical protein
MRLSSPLHHQRGSVVLVALCFLAVLGIALASYLAVSNQAMKLSNRSYQRSISAQLAESGIEQSLWSFNWNNWSAWDRTSVPGSAILHIDYPPSKYGNGVVGRIRLRVDRYDATVWNNFTAYKSSRHDLVWYQGIWYQCIGDTSGTTTPIDGSGKWISAPAPWNASANYKLNNIVTYGDTLNTAYMCAAANINTPPTSSNIPSYWIPVGGTLGNWNSATNYAVDSIVIYGGTSYRCVVTNSGKQPPNAIFWATAPVIYAEGIAEPPDNSTNAIRTQLHALIAPTPLFPNAIAATSTLNLNSGSPLGIVDSYNSSSGPYPSPNIDPRIGYSAILAGGNISGAAVKMTGGTLQGYISAPSGAFSPYGPNVNLAGTVKGTAAGTGIDQARLSRSPYIPQLEPAEWNSKKGYRVNDITRSGPDMYLCKLIPTANQDPSDTTYWTKNAPLSLPSGANVDIGSAGALTPSIYFINFPASGDVDLNVSSETITIKGPVILNIPGALRVQNGGKIIIESTGSVQIFLNGRLRIEGSGGIENQTLDPKKLLIVNAATATPGTHRFSSTQSFYGTIYMPRGTGSFTFSNVSGDPRIYGAISAKYITFNSVANFHYDTSLRTATFAGVDAPYMITEWRELTDPAERVILP